MHTNNYALEVLVNGRPVQEHYKDQRSFIEARNGTEYTLRFRNNSPKRVLAIFSVDGIEVLKGKAAGQADNGYVVDAYASIEVKGYRIDDKTVAAFKFSHGPQSYSVIVGAKTNEPEGDPALGVFKHDKTDRNNGVIGVRVFEEDVANHDYAAAYQKSTYGAISGASFNTLRSGSVVGIGTTSPAHFLSSSGGCFPGYAHAGISLDGTATTFSFSVTRQDVNQLGKMDRLDASALLPFRQYGEHEVATLYSLSCTGMAGPVVSCSSAVAPSFDLGSTWGAKVEDKVREVSFKKVSTATDIVIYYASRQSLESWGIDFSNTKQVFAWPAAFADKKDYCKAPPGYDTTAPATPSLKVWTQR